MELLGKINSPSDLRKLRRKSLPQVSREVRELILDVISQKGGHFASNLGSVDLAVALHYCFETPKDKLVWDVGHQGYPHKILTGRRDQFHTIREHKGLSGFLDRKESPYDHFGAGHASTSISAALGMAEGMRHGGDPHFAIAIIGDGSMTGGIAFEALNNAGHIPAKNLVVVLNDNNMSIDPNVGALQKFLNQRFTSPGYNLLRKELSMLVGSLDAHGVPASPIASKIRKSVKHLFTPEMLYECLGFRYFGPIDGHNVEDLVETFEFIRSEGGANGPYLVHAITTKGKGYKLAEGDPLKYHGVTSFDVAAGLTSKPGAKKTPKYQDVFADTLIKLAKNDPRILAITAAMPSGTSLSKFQKEFPNRCYDVGIAEQHAVLFAAGLATEGFRPVAGIYSTFLQRGFDQLIHDVGLQNLPVFFALDRAGVVGDDGATHQGQFDLSYMRMIPNFVIMAPKDENELQHMIRTGVEYQDGPIAVRYPRGAVTGVEMDEETHAIPIGKGELLNADAEQLDVLLVAVGFSVQSAMDAQSLLQEKGLKVGLINGRFIKPLDEKLLTHWIPRSKLVVSVEENARIGGFGSAILEFMNDKSIYRPFLSVGIPDGFVDHASQPIQREVLQIDGQGIAKQTLAKWEKLEGKISVKRPLTPNKTTSYDDLKHLPLQ